MQKWIIERNPLVVRRVGKTGEECSELLKVINRIILQGIDGIDPGTQKPNIVALTEEIADVMAQCQVSIDALNLDSELIKNRIIEKKWQMVQWETLYSNEVQTDYSLPSDKFSGVP